MNQSRLTLIGAESFKDKIVSINETLAASIENVPFGTDGIEVIENSLF